jgi:hypothetical protein
MKLNFRRKWKQLILPGMISAAQFVRSDLLAGAERISRVVLVLMIVYLLFLTASLLRFLLP